jgi:HSP20 family protein
MAPESPRLVRAAAPVCGSWPGEGVNNMELKIWNPFFDLDRGWRAFDFPRLTTELTGFAFRPSIDLVKKEGELVVTAEVPGMDPEDVEITFEDDVLVIKGEKTEEKEISEDDRYVHERSFGKFQRRIALPSGTSADKVVASYDRGVLTVTVTLPEESKPEPRKIEIEVS